MFGFMGEIYVHYRYMVFKYLTQCSYIIVNVVYATYAKLNTHRLPPSAWQLGWPLELWTWPKFLHPPPRPSNAALSPSHMHFMHYMQFILPLPAPFPINAHIGWETDTISMHFLHSVTISMWQQNFLISLYLSVVYMLNVFFFCLCAGTVSDPAYYG